MDRVCLTKDGKIIEMQSGGMVDRQGKSYFSSIEDYNGYMKACDELELSRLMTLKKNALNAGYTEDQIEVKWVTDAEWAAIQEADKPVPTYREKRVAALPSIGDQLDMQYWDRVNGTTVWQDMITKLKADIPKE
jgi:hypothetical protein